MLTKITESYINRLNISNLMMKSKMSIKAMYKGIETAI